MPVVIGANIINNAKKKMILLHTVSEQKSREDGSALGQSCETFFIFPDYCEDILGAAFEKVKLTDFVGHEVSVDRNRKGFLQALTVIG